MENSGQNGARTDHDRDSKHHGVNGAGAAGQQNVLDKGQAALAGAGAGNAINGSQQPPSGQDPIETTPRMNDLPDEIVHITQGFVPLSLLLTRLAQTTHNALQDKIAELAKIPLPASATNGNSTLPSNIPDDTSNENLRKKATLLNFAQDMHTKWVKALVITEWSRKSEMVSKLIDLKFHIDQQRMLFDAALDNTMNVKRDLTFARMPSPDLKTALQVLSTGKAAWMPDLQYIEPPALTPDEQLKWVNDLDTLLSLRLNLDDFDKIPPPFRNYKIGSGRVTFKVPGEFEVDLTIADEDFEKQFWFIDFRFNFSPSASSLPESLKNYLEAYVNDVLSKDGLAGCYQFLHEFVLTHKLNELKRQAIQLSRGAWTGTLMVEPLNRALAIQYWTSRAPPTEPKSWVLIAVNSSRKQSKDAASKASSHLAAKWYRDNEEVRDAEIPLDSDNLSVEKLLRTVIGRHVEHVLGSIHTKLLGASRFANREAGMVLNISQSNPAESSLTVQVGFKDSAALLIEPTTGLFAVKPHSKFTYQSELQLNNGKNPRDDGVLCLENVRCGFTEDELNRRGSTMGWRTEKCPLKNDELRSFTRTSARTKTIWLQRDGWGPNWFVMVMLSLDGDEWWLLDVNRDVPNQATRFRAKLPLNKGYPDLSGSFWNKLTLFVTGMIAQAVDMRELHRHSIKSRPNHVRNWSMPQHVQLPSIEIALSGIFPSMVFDRVERGTTGIEELSTELGAEQLPSIVGTMTGHNMSKRQPWANDIVTIQFKGVQTHAKSSSSSQDGVTTPLTCTSDAIIKVRRPNRYTALKRTVDRNVFYSPERGEFLLRMRHGVGEPILLQLKSRVQAVDRFVNFMESMDKAKETIQAEKVSLREVSFSYAEPVRNAGGDNPPAPQRQGVTLNLSEKDIDIKLLQGNPHLRVVDLMRTLVNVEGGIEALMVWLPSSLPAMNVLQQIETAWGDIQAQRRGRVEFSMKNIDWWTGGPPKHQQARQVTLEVRIKVRRGEPWWHLWRVASGADVVPEDEFTPLLKVLWETKGENWHGLGTGATARPNSGVVHMLRAIDGAMRSLVDAQ
ncbi:mediator complex subunit MED14-domain-containing protein [Thelonectria olida]|uniref:Mediator of RNA polymerase II transcription subunit 14 n=1 Tax=Thelonectria olida TaxID=1576542 RepID=A0A9P8WAX2_9HYPO|nr:mediator complex subunit MED14-domain-containing protein [Thelonectria olida]